MLLCKDLLYGTKPIWEQSFPILKQDMNFHMTDKKRFASLTKVPISAGIQQVPDIGEIL